MYYPRVDLPVVGVPLDAASNFTMGSTSRCLTVTDNDFEQLHYPELNDTTRSVGELHLSSTLIDIFHSLWIQTPNSKLF